jgi:hypothetical protein
MEGTSRARRREPVASSLEEGTTEGPGTPFLLAVPGGYSFGVKQIATGRITQAAARYGEHAPMATVCCNACRTCVTTNIIGIATAVVGASGLGLRRAYRRIARRTETS